MSQPPAPERLSTDWMLDALAAAGHITAHQRAVAANRLAGSTEHPVLAIAALEFKDRKDTEQLLDAERLLVWLAETSEMPYYRIDPLKLDAASSAKALAYAYARKVGLLVLRKGKDTITIACSDPFDTAWQSELSTAMEIQVQAVLANPADINRYLLEFHSLHKASSSAPKRRGGAQVLENLLRIGRRDKLDEDDQNVIGVVDWLLHYAFDHRASDIHLEPRRDMGRIRLRIDGQLHEIYQLPDNVFAAMCSRLKILAGCNLVERRIPQDGRIKSLSPEGREVELRLSTLPTAFGEKLVLRIFDPGLVAKGVDELGIASDQVQLWKTLCAAPHGLILVTGPTGSGKTTTLYATLRDLASPRRNICTVEDPIELIEPRINQTQVNQRAGLDFADGLRALLRQDPDIIMVGEIRDRATAETSLQAALTGHLVLATLHTNTTVGAVARLLELGAPAYLLRATLLGVLAQRLVRRLCMKCGQLVDAAPYAEAWSRMGVKAKVPQQIRNAVGCLDCRETGYLGRMGLYEILRATPAFKRAITDNAEVSVLEEAARATGVFTLQDAGAQAVADGETSLGEIFHNLHFETL